MVGVALILSLSMLTCQGDTSIYERIANDPTFPCGPSLLPYRGLFSPDVLLWTPDSSYLVFSNDDTIWKVDADGTHLQKVLDANPYGSEHAVRPVFGFHADVSPDGAELAYTSCQFLTEYEVDPKVLLQYGPEWTERTKYHYEIAVLGLDDGGSQQRLTHNRRIDHYPVWSPDGSRIAFVSNLPPPSTDLGDGPWYERQLFSMSAGGLDVKLMSAQAKGVALVPPVWSPDGQRLAFVVNEGGRYIEGQHVYTVRSDGSKLIKVGEMGDLRTTGEPTAAPTWSPDSERVAFAQFDGQEALIHTARFDGADLRRVWNIGSDDDDSPQSISQVSWSPDGSEILIFSSSGVYVGSPDSSGLRNLQASRWPGVVAWSPDGSRIAIYYPSNSFGRHHVRFGYILTIARDGTDIRLLAEEDSDGRFHVATEVRQ